MVNRSGRLVAVAGLLLVGSLVWSQCSATAPAPPPAPKSTVPPPMGDMTPVVSVRELMKFMIDPASDWVFDSIGSEVSYKGLVITEPKTQEDWDKVQTGAVSLAEGIFLLKIKRPFTPAGDVNHSTGPNPPELSPTQIQAKVDMDPVLWDAKIQALRNAALEIAEVAKAKDTNKLFEASGDLDEACEGCHLEYWYPGDKKAVDEWKKAKVTNTKAPKAAAPAAGEPAKK